MAFRRTTRPHRRLTIEERIARVRDSVPVSDDGPSLRDLILDRCKSRADVDRVAGWVMGFCDPEAEGVPPVCCPIDAGRRVHEWLKDDGRDLDDIEEQHTCHPS